MSNRSNETIWPALLFIGTWWSLSYYEWFEQYAYLWTLALWLVGWLAIRMLSSTVHQLGFRGWVLLLEVAAWYALALWLVPLEPLTKILLLWGVATPLLFVGNVWRRTFERFPPVQGLMHGTLNLSAAVGLAAVPVCAWRVGPDFFAQLAQAVGMGAAACLFLYYGWRLAAPPPGAQFDARLGSMHSFRQRGMSDER
jgi:hypothetical protein